MLNLKEIHKDYRGEIYLLEGDLKEDKEITIFSTKSGFARGGCIHRINNEHNVVLEGEIRYFIGEKEIIMKKGDSAIIPRETAHYFVSLTDSLVMEWGCLPEEKVEKYKPFRDIVDKINQNHD